MKNVEALRFCERCVYVFGLGLKNPANGEIINAKMLGQQCLCDLCHDGKMASVKNSKDYFKKQMTSYLEDKKRVLFAYSGGLDSTAVLFLLKKECLKHKIELVTFTINHGYKGIQALDNIKNVIDYLKVNHFWSDISLNKIGSEGQTVLQKYKQCFCDKILPCGKICNSMIDEEYSKIMQELSFSELITGGDTPKKNELGDYSIFWKKPSGLVIIRGGWAFGLTKDLNNSIIKDNNIPWIRPDCGGYDTDCLLPGAFFREALSGDNKIGLKKIAATFPIIFDYLAERVRFGIINREHALEMLEKIDIGSKENYFELQEIFRILKS